MYMNVAPAENKYLIYHFDIIILYHEYIKFNLLSSFYTDCRCILIEIHSKCGLISIS